MNKIFVGAFLGTLLGLTLAFVIGINVAPNAGYEITFPVVWGSGSFGMVIGGYLGSKLE